MRIGGGYRTPIPDTLLSQASLEEARKRRHQDAATERLRAGLDAAGLALNAAGGLYGQISTNRNAAAQRDLARSEGALARSSEMDLEKIRAANRLAGIDRQVAGSKDIAEFQGKTDIATNIATNAAKLQSARDINRENISYMSDRDLAELASKEKLFGLESAQREKFHTLDIDAAKQIKNLELEQQMKLLPLETQEKLKLLTASQAGDERLQGMSAQASLDRLREQLAADSSESALSRSFQSQEGAADRASREGMQERSLEAEIQRILLGGDVEGSLQSERLRAAAEEGAKERESKARLEGLRADLERELQQSDLGFRGQQASLGRAHETSMMGQKHLYDSERDDKEYIRSMGRDAQLRRQQLEDDAAMRDFTTGRDATLNAYALGRLSLEQAAIRDRNPDHIRQAVAEEAARQQIEADVPPDRAGTPQGSAELELKKALSLYPEVDIRQGGFEANDPYTTRENIARAYLAAQQGGVGDAGIDILREKIAREFPGGVPPSAAPPGGFWRSITDPGGFDRTQQQRDVDAVLMRLLNSESVPEAAPEDPALTSRIKALQIPWDMQLLEPAEARQSRLDQLLPLLETQARQRASTPEAYEEARQRLLRRILQRE